MLSQKRETITIFHMEIVYLQFKNACFICIDLVNVMQRINLERRQAGLYISVGRQIISLRDIIEDGRISREH